MSKLQHTPQRADDYGVTAQYSTWCMRLLRAGRAVLPGHRRRAKRSDSGVGLWHGADCAALGPAAGHRVHGLDLSAVDARDLRAQLTQRPQDVRQRISLAQGDMASFEFDERFGLIWRHSARTSI